MEKENKSNKNKTKYNAILVAVLVIVGLALVFASSGPACCDNKNEVASSTDNVVANDPPAEVAPAVEKIKVELYHFHGTHQCSSCTRLGELAEKTVETYFADEVESGDLVFDHINYDLPENEELAKKFGVTGSSLWIGTTIDSEFHKEENINVWYKLNDESGYLSYLKDLIEKRLEGNLS